jgi:NitT/TauT family transport system ATP-binding protein
VASRFIKSWSVRRAHRRFRLAASAADADLAPLRSIANTETMSVVGLRARIEDRRRPSARDLSSSSDAVDIVVRDVSKGFAGGRGAARSVVSGFDLAVGPGEFVSLIGPSGSGKSTILRLVAGLLKPDAGEIRVGGRDAGEARLEKMFGLVPQTPALLPWLTVAQNITVLAEVKPIVPSPVPDGDAVTNLMTMVGLAKVADLLPNQLSGGMQQRVSLVRAFALGAPVLLMDEPFAALDEITRSDMRYLLLGLWQKTRPTVLFVTHSISEAVVMSDRIVVLSATGAEVIADEPVSLPRPRTEDMEDTEPFIYCVRRVRGALRSG